jgi:two-component system response regulator YesN
VLQEELVFEEHIIVTWMRDRFLQDLVAGRHQARTDLRDSLTRLKLNPYYTFPAIALLEPRRHHMEEHESHAYAEQIRDFVQALGVPGFTVFLDEEGRVALLFSWVSKDRLTLIIEQVEARFLDKTSVGVGKPSSLLGDVHHSYLQAATALKHKFYRGVGQMIQYSELQRYATLAQYPVELESRLFEAFKAADSAEEVTQAGNAFYDNVLAEGPLSSQCLYDLTVRLLVGMEQKARNESRSIGCYDKFDVLSVVKLETIDEIKQYVIRFLIGLRRAMGNEERESHRSIIKKTIQHMEQECQYVSLQSVAQKVYMTPTYLSLLFKTNTGKTFIEHLTDIRISKAKDMLKSTHYKNYEVAELVGYQDPRYFSQIFKKKVGLSPSEYRESIGQ